MEGHYSTRSVRAGETKHKPYNAITTPIIQSSTYTFQDSAEILEFMQDKEAGRSQRTDYGRYGNPTQSAVEAKLADLEGGQKALLFASGMNAVTTALLSLLAAGDHLIMVSDSYHRTREFTTALLSRWGIATTLVSIDDPEEWQKAMRPNTRLIFSETPTNPYLRVMDLAQMVSLAQQHNLISIVDSTFATPINLRPLQLGVDLVIQSCTKYLGGHNDLLAGAVIGSHPCLSDIEKVRGILGGVSSPLDAYLLLRGLKTLALRVQRQNENGLRIAQFLEGRPQVQRVYYPGLPSHPDHAIACRLLSGFGSVVSFEIAGDFAKTSRFIDLLKLPFIGPTLGGVESIIEQPATLFSLEPLERKKAGIKDNLVRYAIGIEDPEDIIADLEQALDKINS